MKTKEYKYDSPEVEHFNPSRKMFSDVFEQITKLKEENKNVFNLVKKDHTN